LNGFGAHWIALSLSYRNPANPRPSMTDHYRSRSMSHRCLCINGNHTWHVFGSNYIRATHG